MGPRYGPPGSSSEGGYAPLGLPRPAFGAPRRSRGAPLFFRPGRRSRCRRRTRARAPPASPALRYCECRARAVAYRGPPSSWRRRPCCWCGTAPGTGRALAARERRPRDRPRRVARAELDDFPAQLLPGGSTASALDRVAHVDAAVAHRRHVGGQVIALHDDVAEPAAAGQELDEAGAREMPFPGPHGQQLEIVVLKKRDGVVSALAVMNTPGVDAEPQARVGVDPLLQIGDTDHDVVDPGQHELLVVRRRVAELGALWLVVVES